MTGAMGEGRFGFDAGKAPLEEALTWAAESDFAFVEFSVDGPANAPAAWTGDRVSALRRLTVSSGVGVGLHTSSAVNVAETSPLMSAAADGYLRTVIELAARLGCAWAVVHGGYHFTQDVEARMSAAIERLAKACEWASAAGVELRLENHNREPDDAEIHYMPFNVEQTRKYLEELRHPAMRWTFNAAHANLVAEGIDGFLDELGIERLAQVRLNDNDGLRERHLLPGEGSIDFQALFHRLKAEGYRGPLVLGFGTWSDMGDWRERWERLV